MFTFFRHHRVARYVAVASAIPLLLLAGCIALFQIDAFRNRAYAEMLRERLGYQEEYLIDDYNQCWDMLSRCGIVTIYRTDHSQAQFTALVDALGFEGYADPTVAGSYLFTQINIDTQWRLTADGNDDMGLSSVPPNKLPDAIKWVLTSPEGRKLRIYHYALPHDQAVYELDGERFAGNIVIFTLLTRP